jgi:transposase-like protein
MGAVGQTLMMGQCTMARRKHSTAEVAAWLAQAREMAEQGKLQNEIAATLGISVMTLHRWRKASMRRDKIEPGMAPCEQGIDQNKRVAELQLENSRLRRLVTDLLLEKMDLEESIRGRDSQKSDYFGRMSG